MQKNSFCVFTPTIRSLPMKIHLAARLEVTWDIYEVTSSGQCLIFMNKRKEFHNLSVRYAIKPKFLVLLLFEISKYILRINKYLFRNFMGQRTNLSIWKTFTNINKMLTVKRLLDLLIRSLNGMNNTMSILWILKDAEKLDQSKTWLWSKKKIHKSM
jgi:hypothetical protein